MFEIVDHVLVGNVEHRAGRQDRSPVSHQLVVAAVIAAQFGQVVAERLTLVEEFRKARNARIDRVTHRVDDAGIGQDQAYQSDK